MELGRRALFNLLRMNWEKNPKIDVEPWQVENYRQHTYKELFFRLSAFDLHLDKNAFTVYAENFDSPEDLTDAFLEETDLPPGEQDQIYLLIFELWRRLLPEKISLSIFCDELDHQIQKHDMGKGNEEELQDTLAHLLVLLDENIDQSEKPEKLFETVNASCAQELEAFLYDYIAELFDEENFSYASELIDGFIPYIRKNKWFDLLHARSLFHTDPEEGFDSIEKLAQKAVKEEDLDFNLELLSFLIQDGDQKLFVKIVKKSLPLLEKEEDLTELLLLCADYYNCIDSEDNEHVATQILKSREHLPHNQKLKPSDKVFEQIKSLIK
ncbi:MAG: hypothetical protein WDZ27_01370 [Waddliaceae bacterium]